MVTSLDSTAPVPARAPHPVFNSAVGGALCLDFVNTVGGWVLADADGEPGREDVARVERLTTYEALVDWAGWMGILDARQELTLLARARVNRRAAIAALRRAQRLRDGIYRLGRSVTDRLPTPSADLDVLNRELGIARAHQRLTAPGTVGARTDPYLLGWTDDHALDTMLWAVALSAVDLLTSDRISRLGRCPASACGWLFLDTSRSGRRQWCDMAVCGNAEKVRRFRERQRRRPGAARRA